MGEGGEGRAGDKMVFRRAGMALPPVLDQVGGLCEKGSVFNMPAFRMIICPKYPPFCQDI